MGFECSDIICAYWLGAPSKNQGRFPDRSSGGMLAMSDLRHAMARCSSPWSAKPTQSEQGTHPAIIYTRVLQMTSSPQACCDHLLRKCRSASESAPHISSIASNRVLSPQPERMRIYLSLRMSSRIAVRTEIRGTDSEDIVVFVRSSMRDLM